MLRFTLLLTLFCLIVQIKAQNDEQVEVINKDALENGEENEEFYRHRQPYNYAPHHPHQGGYNYHHGK